MEIFAGQDKVVKVGTPLSFNDAELIKPDPPDPERTYTFRWDFDDMVDMDLDSIRDNDGQSHDRYTEWTYHRTGVFVVTLTVSDGIHVAKETLTVTVIENFPPTLLVSGDHMACVGMPTKLSVTAVDIDDDVELLRWEWNMGDGGRSEERGPVTYTYEEMGVFTVHVVVTDPSGNDAHASYNVTVIDGNSPVCDAGSDVSTMVNSTVHFDGSKSRDNVGVTGWRWSFEYNGSVVTLTGPQPEFTFWTAGTYIVGLKVTDEAGNEDMDTMTVMVKTPGGDLPEDTGQFEPKVDDMGMRAIVLTLLIVVCIAISVVINYWRRVYVSSQKEERIFFPDLRG